MNKLHSFISGATILACLTACGGGSSSSPSDTTPSNNTPSSSSTSELRVLSNNVNTASFIPLQARALDENGQPLENKTVDFSSTNSNISFSQTSCQTNRVGVCSVNVNTQAAGSYDVDVKIDNEAVRNSPASITFKTESSVTVINNGALANNTDAITLRAHIVDSSNAPVANEVVTFDNSSINVPVNGEINFSALTCTTNASGVCDVTVRSLGLGFNYGVGVSTSSGSVGSSSVGFFFSRIGKTGGLLTSITPRIVNNTNGSDDGILINAVVSDAFNQFVDYEEVSFQSNSSDVTLSSSRCFTRGTSGCSIKLTSAQAGRYNITASIADGALNGSQPIQVEFFAPVSNVTPSQAFNDTGITIGGNFPSGNNNSCIGESVAYQDCSHGRDNTNNNDSNGLGGFDFTKLDANGNALAASASSWSCVRDNVTGLIWEVKTTDGGLRDRNHRYTSYDSSFSNGDSTADASNVGTDKIWAGLVDTGINSGQDNCGDNNRMCTTEQYVTNVNNATLCGANDWRMPTINELQDMANLGQRGTSLDRGYFPNQISTRNDSFVWSSTPRYISNSNSEALGFSYYTGIISHDSRSDSGAVRLVRKAPAPR